LVTQDGNPITVSAGSLGQAAVAAVEALFKGWPHWRLPGLCRVDLLLEAESGAGMTGRKKSGKKTTFNHGSSSIRMAATRKAHHSTLTAVVLEVNARPGGVANAKPLAQGRRAGSRGVGSTLMSTVLSTVKLEMTKRMNEMDKGQDASPAPCARALFALPAWQEAMAKGYWGDSGVGRWVQDTYGLEVRSFSHNHITTHEKSHADTQPYSQAVHTPCLS
jgi:hypothetical protein